MAYSPLFSPFFYFFFFSLLGVQISQAVAYSKDKALVALVS